MDSSKYDVVIVGMGLAGIQLSFELNKRGKKVLHIHKSLSGESTRFAAGLINPITGRRYVKSWKIDEVMPFAETRYKELKQLLGGEYLKRVNIVRGLKSPAEENTWLSKSADPYLSEFLLDKQNMANQEDNIWAFAQKLSLTDLLGELKDCFRIEVINLQKDYLDYIRKRSYFLDEIFEFDHLVLDSQSIKYKDVSANHIVFCEGWRVLENPFFQIPGFSPAKGELFIVYAPDLQLKKAYKKDMFITPLGDDLYWCGATYEWQNYTCETTDKMRDRLLNFMEDTMKVDYEIKHHYFGLRPSSKDRRPVLGTHPDYPQLSIFNGMGTKGTSLAPYYSTILADHIINGNSIPYEVDVQRYFDKL